MCLVGQSLLSAVVVYMSRARTSRKRENVQGSICAKLEVIGHPRGSLRAVPHVRLPSVGPMPPLVYRYAAASSSMGRASILLRYQGALVVFRSSAKREMRAATSQSTMSAALV